MSHFEQPIEIRVRQQDTRAAIGDTPCQNPGISCTGSYTCAELAPSVLTVDESLGMCAVKNGSTISVEGVQYSSGSLEPDQVPQATAAALNCDSEAVLLVDRSGAVYTHADEAVFQPLNAVEH